MEPNEIAKTTRNVLFLFFLLFMEVSGNKWSYKGKVGPEFWHKLFTTCSGKKQSPINIISKETVHEPKLTDFAIWFDPPHPQDHMIVINNGHTVKVKTVGKFHITNGGLPNVYKTAQLHFHWGPHDDIGSEHQIDSVTYPLELHIVNYDHSKYTNLHEAMTKEFGLAVLGVMFKLTDEDNPVLNPIIDVFEEIQKPGHPKIRIKAQSIRNFLPKDASKFYRYHGSLTTPGCYETVIWTIFKQANYISHRQMKKLRGLFYNKEVGGHPDHHNHHHDHDKLIELKETIIEVDVKNKVDPPALKSVDKPKPVNNSEEDMKQTETPTHYIDDSVSNDTKAEITTHSPNLEVNYKQPTTEIPAKITDVELNPEEMVMGKEEVVVNNNATASPIEESKPAIKNEESPKEISGTTSPRPLESSNTDKKEAHVAEMQRDAGYVQSDSREPNLIGQKQQLSKHKNHHHHHHHHHDNRRKKRDVQGEVTHDDNAAVAAAAPEIKKEEIPEKETNFLTEGDKKVDKLEEEIHKSDEIFKEIEEKLKPHKIEQIHISNNYRPIQPLNDRIVLRSFPSFEEDPIPFTGYGVPEQRSDAVCSNAESVKKSNAGFYLTLSMFSFIANLLRLA